MGRFGVVLSLVRIVVLFLVLIGMGGVGPGAECVEMCREPQDGGRYGPDEADDRPRHVDQAGTVGVVSRVARVALPVGAEGVGSGVAARGGRSGRTRQPDARRG